MFVQLPGDSLLWRELQNTGHTILFATITLIFMVIMRSVVPAAINRTLAGYAITGMAMFTVAVLTELGQQLTHREPSLSDLVRDMAGIVVGLGLYAYMDPRLNVVCKQHSQPIKNQHTFDVH